jgi:DNA-binding transcriptional regulator YdaS (Cro superfamily)
VVRQPEPSELRRRGGEDDQGAVELVGFHRPSMSAVATNRSPGAAHYALALAFATRADGTGVPGADAKARTESGG